MCKLRYQSFKSVIRPQPLEKNLTINNYRGCFYSGLQSRTTICKIRTTNYQVLTKFITLSLQSPLIYLPPPPGHLYIVQQGRRNRGGGGGGKHLLPPTRFWQMSQPCSNQGNRLCSPHKYLTPRFLGLPPALKKE